MDSAEEGQGDAKIGCIGDITARISCDDAPHTPSLPSPLPSFVPTSSTTASAPAVAPTTGLPAARPAAALNYPPSTASSASSFATEPVTLPTTGDSSGEAQAAAPDVFPIPFRTADAWEVYMDDAWDDEPIDGRSDMYADDGSFGDYTKEEVHDSSATLMCLQIILSCPQMSHEERMESFVDVLGQRTDRLSRFGEPGPTMPLISELLYPQDLQTEDEATMRASLAYVLQRYNDSLCAAGLAFPQPSLSADAAKVGLAAAAAHQEAARTLKQKIRNRNRKDNTRASLTATATATTEGDHITPNSTKPVKGGVLGIDDTGDKLIPSSSTSPLLGVLGLITQLLLLVFSICGALLVRVLLLLLVSVTWALPRLAAGLPLQLLQYRYGPCPAPKPPPLPPDSVEQPAPAVEPPLPHVPPDPNAPGPPKPKMSQAQVTHKLDKLDPTDPTAPVGSPGV